MARKKKVQDTEIPEFTPHFELDEYIPFKIVQLQLLMRQIIELEITHIGGRAAELSRNETRIITFLALKEPTTPSQIATSMRFDRAVVTRVVGSLKRKGLVTTQSSPQDQRSKSVSISADGIEVVGDLLPAMRNISDHLDSALTTKEKQTLMQLFQKLLLSSNEYIEHLAADE